MNHQNELELRAGDFGWIVSADALCPDVTTTLRDITAVLRSEASEEQEWHRGGMRLAFPPCVAADAA